MSEEEEVKDVNNQEPVVPETDSTEQTQNQVVEGKEDSKEFNFARLREKAELSEKKSMQLEDEINRLKAAVAKDSKQEVAPQEDDLADLSNDDLLTVKQAKRLAERQVQQTVQKMFQEREKAALPQKAKAKFGDFDKVMTNENIKKLELEEPELAMACMNAPNPWESTYKILKKFILPTGTENVEKGTKKMEENLSKPSSVNSASRSGALSNANAWAESSKDDLYKEMMQAANQL